MTESERDADFSKLGSVKEPADEGNNGPMPGSPEPEVAPPTTAELQRLTQQNEQLRKDSDEHREKYLRALADFENFKKRSIKERSDLLKYAGEKVLYDLLDIADNFERALASQDADAAALRTGVEMIQKQLLDILRKHEVRAEPAQGSQFDPVKHEALSQMQVDDAAPGTVMQEFRKAYLYKDKLLRTAQVVVAAKPEQRQPEDSGASSENADKSEG